MRTHPPIGAAVRTRRAESGFTLTELIVTLSFLAIIMISLATILFTANKSNKSSSNSIESIQAARVAMEMIADDLRSAGFNADTYQSPPQPPIAYVDSLELLINSDLQPFPHGNVNKPPLAYSPSLSPNPRPLVATSWTPAMKYTTGAELIRYTLDANNDGAIDNSDLQVANGSDALRSKNPSDYVLLRQVYGDSMGGVPNTNGGPTERIALVLKPGVSGVAPMFTVYLKNSATPYDWSNGPVPANQLSNIERVEVRVTAGSSSPDWGGNYPKTELRTQVNSLRNIPQLGQTLYWVTGSVFADNDASQAWSTGDAPIPNALVRLGTKYTAYTSASGAFAFQAPAGTYTLRHTPPVGFGCLSDPDSFVVVVPTATTYAFADTARQGGYLACRVWNDEDGDGVWNGAELGMQNVLVSASPGGGSAYTDASGSVSLFAPVGVYTVTATLPDTMVATTANPQTGSMINGGSASHDFGARYASKGTVAGKVYNDANRNGVYDAGEGGKGSVWVGVTNDNGVTIAGFQYTDSLGDYSILVPINDPPHTVAYSVFMIVPAGFYATSRTSLSPVWVQSSITSSGYNFGVSGYTVITLAASRVLSLASADVIEKDWNGNQTQNARGDADIVLGSDAGGSDQVSVWWNEYNASQAFSGSANVLRVAPQAVLSVALDVLDANGNTARPDLVAGMKYATSPAANFGVWYFQDNPNEGSLATAYTDTTKVKHYRTLDQGEVHSVLTIDCAGGTRPDILVGTMSPTSGNGTIEVWRNNEQTTPTFTRVEQYPTFGSIPGGKLGEVNAMVLADINADGRKDLVVGTKTGTYSGEILILENVSNVTGARFVFRKGLSVPGEAVTALAVLDVNSDGYPDIVSGTQSSVTFGDLMYWRNKTSTAPWDFALDRQIDAPGLVQSLAVGDMGGGSSQDLLMGFRTSPTGYAGGVRIYYTDSGTIPFIGVDPSPASQPVVNFVPALTVNNFNYGVKPSLPSPPYLPDFAAGVKVDATTGQLVIFIR